MNPPFSVDALEVLVRATELHKLNFGAQAHIRAVSVTIAKLGHAKEVLPDHMHEAMQYRVRGV
jgi:predicted ATPase with chaperone activity